MPTTLFCCSVPAGSWRSQALAAMLRSILVGLLALVLEGGTALAQSASLSSKIGPSLRGRLVAASDSEVMEFSVVIADDTSQRRRLPTIERHRAVHARQQAVLDSLPQWGHRARRLENVSGFSGRGTRGTIEAIVAHPLVERVYLEIRLRPLMAEGVPLIGADHAAVLGVTGSGINVAVLDGGVMTDHPDLEDSIVREACFCRSRSGAGCCPDGNPMMTGEGAAEDSDGHGTMVTGIITSSGTETSPGVAPAAGIVAIRVTGQAGNEISGSAVDNALDWLLSNHSSLGVRVINLSLGTDSAFSDDAAFPCTGTLTASLIGDLAAAGVATFIASGNGGIDDGISFPACISDAISVGGVYDADVGGVNWPTCSDQASGPDVFACHTNSAPILDMLAPDWRTRTTSLGGGSSDFGGTSAAAPYASALAALLLEQDPSRMPSDLKTLLTSDAPMVTNSENGLSFPRADVSALFQFCGDGEVSGNEECDDGNSDGGDCCSEVCEFEAVGLACDDQDACMTGESCDGAGGCGGALPIVCDDALYCNGLETCDSDLGCQPGTPPELSDGVACTADACDDVADEVRHVPDDAACDNGLFCDGSEICDAQLDCQPGVAPTEDDGVACTTESCDEAADSFIHIANDAACDNGLFCDGSEICDAQLDCQPGVAHVEDDGVACTVDSCDEATGGAIHAADSSLCDDSDPCTADLCDAILGCQNDPILECAVPVPIGRFWTGSVLATLLLVTSVLFFRRIAFGKRLFLR